MTPLQRKVSFCVRNFLFQGLINEAPVPFLSVCSASKSVLVVVAYCQIVIQISEFVENQAQKEGAEFEALLVLESVFGF